MGAMVRFRRDFAGAYSHLADDSPKVERNTGLGTIYLILEVFARTLL